MHSNVSEYAAILARMRSRWSEVVAAAGDVDHATAVRKCEEWEVALQELKAEHDQLVAEGRWISGPGDLLSVIGRSRREVFHSRVLSWLLDPAGAHGFRDAFLAAVLKQCYPRESFPEGELLLLKTRCEVSRTNSRADIVASSQRLTLIFEVKIEAGERANQCSDIFEDWGRDPDPHFIFLTPRGHSAKSAKGPAADAFKTLSFPQIRDILQQLLDGQQGDSAWPIGSRTARSYLDTLNEEF